MSPYRAVEWREPGPGHRVGERQVLPEDVAAAAINGGLAAGVTLLRFKVSAPPYNAGETAGLFDHVAARLVGLDWAEPVPVRPSAGDQGAEAKAVSAAPVDRMVHNTTVTKEVKP